MRVREQVDEPGACGSRRRQCAEQRGSAARGEREFVELSKSPRATRSATISSSGLKSSTTVSAAVVRMCRSYAESTGAGAEHQYFAWCLIAQQRGEQLERGLILRIAPAPVAMDVGVVRR